jgi:hypothetical protein
MHRVKSKRHFNRISRRHNANLVKIGISLLRIRMDKWTMKLNVFWLTLQILTVPVPYGSLVLLKKSPTPAMRMRWPPPRTPTCRHSVSWTKPRDLEFHVVQQTNNAYIEGSRPRWPQPHGYTKRKMKRKALHSRCLIYWQRIGMNEEQELYAFIQQCCSV